MSQQEIREVVCKRVRRWTLWKCYMRIRFLCPMGWHKWVYNNPRRDERRMCPHCEHHEVWVGGNAGFWFNPDDGAI